MFNIIEVRFDSDTNSKEYSYLTDIEDLKVGDLVVVDARSEYKTATVSSLFGHREKANKWVVCKVNIEAFEQKLESLKRKQFIYRQMEQKMERVNMLSQFARVAEQDEEMKRLYEEFTTIDSQTRQISED